MDAKKRGDGLKRGSSVDSVGCSMRGVLFVAALLAIAPVESLATTYYVDQNHPLAADSNPGTEALPWKTLYRAGDPLGTEIVAGDTVLVKAATYVVSTGGNWSRPAIIPVNSGQPGKPITFKAYPGHTVILDVQNVLANPAIGSVSRDYIVIDGFTIINAGDKGVVVTAGGARVKGVVIRNNTISGLWRSDHDNTDAIRIQNASYTEVRNNRIYDVHNGKATHNAAGIKLYQTDHTLVENNEIYDVEAGIYDKQQGEFNTFRRNLIHHCGDVGIEISWDGTGPDGRDDQIYENIIYNCRVGVRVMATSGGRVYNTSIYNNVFAYYSDTGLHTPSLDYYSNTRFWNNIFYRTGASGRGDFFTYDNPPAHIALANYNLFVTGPRILVGVYDSNETTYSSLAAWQSASGRDMDSLVADPLFVNAAANNFRLQVGSPALGAGRVGGTGAGAVVNIGAYTTGTEVVGIITSDATPPNPPTGLTIR